MDGSEIICVSYLNLLQKTKRNNRYINQIFKPNLETKYTRMKMYKILARPTLAYSSESWTIGSNDKKILISAEIRFIRRTLGYKLFDHKRNEDLMHIMDKQLKTTPIINFVTQHRKNWKEHVHRMTPDRIPKIILKYQPKGKRCLGHPSKDGRTLLCNARNRP
jgi:hypothetical protein